MNRAIQLPAAFILLFLGLSATSISAEESGWSAPSGPNVTKVGERVYVVEAFYLNSVFVVGDDGVLLMDTYNPGHARMLREQIRKVTDLPVKYVVYSHAHTDHVNGGIVFVDTAQFVAQSRTAKQLARVQNSTFVPADIVFEDQWQLPLKGVDAVLLDFGPNHATGVSVLFSPGDRVVTLTDLAYYKRWRFGSMPNESPGEIVRTLREIAKLNFQLGITGHGRMVNRDEMLEHADFLADLMAQVSAAIENGREEGISFFEMPAYVSRTVDTSKYDSWGLAENREANIQAVYSSLIEGF